MITPAPSKYDAVKFEREIREWWKTDDIYKKVKRLHAGDPTWFFLDGPPYASGAIHLGTAWNKIIKDAILRYKGMRGFNVLRQPGWDCHGLPIEVKVEEKLAVKSKKDIERVVGVQKFVEECKQWAMKHVRLMTEQFASLGVWMDWDSPYITFTDDFIEAAWWTLKRAHDKGLLRKDLRVIHWCPRCETALAEHEVRGEYQEVRDPSLFARFKLVDKPNEYLLIWTTTPWTLPANLAVCVHPEYEYARVEVGEAIYILVRALVDAVMKTLGVEYKLLDIVRGKELEGLFYEHPLLEEVPKQREFVNHHRVICGKHVTLKEGTGCVHTAPGHGEEDFAVGASYGLPVFNPVGPDGKFTAEAGKYAGIFVKDADRVILEDLKRKGVLMKWGMVVHSYPHCWRCQTPLLFRATEQWFLTTSSIKPLLLEKNTKVTWVPGWVAKRFTDGVESVGDWCISRQRYWGIPLPFWVCESCNAIKVVGGKQELADLALTPVGEIDLHRPQVDGVKLRCACGGEMSRVPEVLDVWFDSGICSWASLGYPGRGEGFKELWPSDFITEGEDQVTKWFYSQQAASVIALDEVPYEKVLMHGFALDAHGRKMSKSLGNVVEPWEITEKYGADVLRFYMLSANAPWEDLRFNWKGVETVQRMLNVLWNVHVFATTYMALDAFDPTKVDMKRVSESFAPEDIWLLSRINSVAREVTQAFENLDLHLATRTAAWFALEDLSRWYVKLIRGRAWIEREDPKKLAAYVALCQALHTLVRLLAPIIPHMTEVMYRGLVRAADPKAPESVHMLPWPAVREEMIDPSLEEGMNIARALVEAGASARQQAKLKLRWPVAKAILQLNSPDAKALLTGLELVLKEQLNCKELAVLAPGEEVAELRPVCKVKIEKLAPRLGGELASAVATTLARMDGARVRAELERYGFLGLQVRGQKINVLVDEVEFEGLPEGFVEARTDFGKVVIDARLTPELKAECLARELVRRLQMMRKEQGLAMEERVDVMIGTDVGEYVRLLAGQREYLCREVRIRNLRLCSAAEVAGLGYLKEWDIDGDRFKLLLARIG